MTLHILEMVRWENTYDHTTLTHKALSMLEIGRVPFLVCVNEYQVERSGGRREGLDGFCARAKDDVNLLNETCGGEVLGCDFDALGVHF